MLGTQRKRGTIYRAPPPEVLARAKTDDARSVLAGGLRGRGFLFARGHRDDDVFSLLAVGFRNAKDEFVLVDAELRGFTDGKQRRVLIVFRADAIDDVVG